MPTLALAPLALLLTAAQPAPLSANRAPVAVPAAGGGNHLSWRLLNEDGTSARFVIRRDGKVIARTATPDLIQFSPGLPKTRSGKIMRRILRKIAEDEPGSLGDTTTLADPTVVTDLVDNRQNKKA